MTDYWIRDVEGRVLGPVSLAVLKDLCSARRLMGVTHVSRDGSSWSELKDLPELASMLAPQPDQAVQTAQREEAQRLRSQLQAAERAPAHLVFKVPEDAPLEAWRSAYFALARRFHPTRLAPETHPDLVDASREAFSLFARKIAEVERRLAGAVRTQASRAAPSLPVAHATPPPPPPEAFVSEPSPARGSEVPRAPRLEPVDAMPAVAAMPLAPAPAVAPVGIPTPIPPSAELRPPAARMAPPSPRPAVQVRPPSTPTPAPIAVPEYRPEDFVGIERRGAERLHASVRVTPSSYRMFTDHALVNISNSGLFINTPNLIPVGSLLDMELTFEGQERIISARARVVWESAGTDGKNPRGMGLKLTSVAEHDLAFIRDFVRKAALAAPVRAY